MTEDKKEDLGMEFGLDSAEKIISHWMLHDIDAAERIAQTPEWKDRKDFRGGGLTARVTVNGVELPFESFDRWLFDFIEREDEKRAARFADIEKEVQRRLEERFKEEVEPIKEKLYRLVDLVDDCSSALKPYWEKNEG